MSASPTVRSPDTPEEPHASHVPLSADGPRSSRGAVLSAESGPPEVTGLRRTEAHGIHALAGLLNTATAEPPEVFLPPVCDQHTAKSGTEQGGLPELGFLPLLLSGATPKAPSPSHR
jgi:hypothetical protein